MLFAPVHYDIASYPLFLELKPDKFFHQDKNNKILESVIWGLNQTKQKFV